MGLVRLRMAPMAATRGKTLPRYRCPCTQSHRPCRRDMVWPLERYCPGCCTRALPSTTISWAYGGCYAHLSRARSRVKVPQYVVHWRSRRGYYRCIPVPQYTRTPLPLHRQLRVVLPASGMARPFVRAVIGSCPSAASQGGGGGHRTALEGAHRTDAWERVSARSREHARCAAG